MNTTEFTEQELNELPKEVLIKLFLGMQENIKENLHFFDPVSVRLLQMGFCRYFSFAFCGSTFLIYRNYLHTLLHERNRHSEKIAASKGQSITKQAPHHMVRSQITCI